MLQVTNQNQVLYSMWSLDAAGDQSESSIPESRAVQ